jgi:hypothetical protein
MAVFCGIESVSLSRSLSPSVCVCVCVCADAGEGFRDVSTVDVCFPRNYIIHCVLYVIYYIFYIMYCASVVDGVTSMCVCVWVGGCVHHASIDNVHVFGN